MIEYDGIQHFKYTNKGWNTKEHFEKTQKSDKIKNKYALTHNIPLVRIPYTKLGKITLEDLLGDEYLVNDFYIYYNRYFNWMCWSVLLFYTPPKKYY